MKDISILAFFGIEIDDLEYYSFEDIERDSISISITRKRVATSCPCCGVFTNRVKDYSNKRYLFRNINGYDLKVFYKQRRYYCPVCHKGFMEGNPFTQNRNYKLSGLKIAIIINRLKLAISIKQIAEDVGVSESSVIKVLDKYYRPPHRSMPQILCIDEFMSFNSNLISKYSCLLIDFESGNIIDLIQSRQKVYLDQYFNNVPKEQREKVHYIIIDMYKPYKDAANKYFPNAIVIIDPFHFVRYVTKAIDSVRVRVMSAFLEVDEQYKLLKKYRNLLLMKYEPDTRARKRRRILNDLYLTDRDVLNRMLCYDEELKYAYQIGHSFLSSYSNYCGKEFETFLTKTIGAFATSNIKEFVDVAYTYQNWFEEICNSRLTEASSRAYSNGPIEGRNNKIKMLKRVSYGMTNFDHLKKRIFLIFDKKNH